MKYIYPAHFYFEDNGQYSVVFEDLDNISTYGNNLEDAIDMATDLLCMWILDSNLNELPKPSNPKNIILNNENEFVNFIVADIDTYKTKRSKSVKKTLTIPLWLNDIAEKEKINYSQLLQEALKEYLNIQV